MGAAVELALPVSVVAAGHKLNVTAVTLGERLQLGFLAMPEAVPHIEELARNTEQAYAELRAALSGGTPIAAPALARTRRPTPAKKPTAKKTAPSHKAAARTPTVRKEAALRKARKVSA